ncbi:MAG: hypothetical protein H7239_15365 [Flavobacterium sp.]|nr:hypothetical protein [Flavobacterium sp.]
MCLPFRIIVTTSSKVLTALRKLAIAIRNLPTTIRKLVTAKTKKVSSSKKIKESRKHNLHNAIQSLHSNTSYHKKKKPNLYRLGFTKERRRHERSDYAAPIKKINPFFWERVY